MLAWAIPVRCLRRHVNHFLQEIARDEEGGTAALIAVSIIILTAFVGLSVDTARGYMLKQRLSYAVDAAALAAAKASANAADIDATGQRYFAANFPDGYMDAKNLTITFTLSADKTRVSAEASAALPTALMKLLGIDNVDVGAIAVAERQAKGLELALALDNTGSMGNHMGKLKDATNLLLDSLYGNRDTVPNLWVGIVPFDTRVNLADYPGVVGFTPSKGSRVCANARDFPDTTNDAPPSGAPFDSEWTDWGVGCRGVSALALTASKATLKDKVDDLVRAGYTRVDEGAAWAFRMLSPEWQGLWGDPELPKDYDEPLMEKAAIIMTDGENTPRDGLTPDEADARLLEVCTNMKDADITVYTVQYRTSSGRLEDLLTECATSAAHYYHANDGALGGIFQEIASKLTNLRLIN